MTLNSTEERVARVSPDYARIYADARSQMMNDMTGQDFDHHLALVAFAAGRQAQDALTRTDNDVSGLVEALEPFARTWEEAQAYADFDGEDCRENYIGGSVNRGDWERAYTALAKHRQSNGGAA
jgi:hypothetical protein